MSKTKLDKNTRVNYRTVFDNIEEQMKELAELLKQIKEDQEKILEIVNSRKPRIKMIKEDGSWELIKRREKDGNKT